MHQSTIERIKKVRAQVIHHTRMARQFAIGRRDSMQGLRGQGVSQATSHRELGVTSQSIQKMLVC
ncbi:hypothetical protein ACIBAC_42375 [Streptomyces sp. NPDC051362]|uniref:hypothetical protein n=1 Tax=Streptomyces sp. NPDC051362 TaxID=3365651 RepID=UPI0037B957BB